MICPFCEESFTPKNPQQQICGKPECKKKRQKARLTLNIELNRERYKRQWREAGQRRATGVGSGNWRKQIKVGFIPCYYCSFLIKKTDLVCEYCGTPVDKHKDDKFIKKESKGYWDIVRENAVRAGKNPGVEVRRVRAKTRVLTGLVLPPEL